MSAQPQSASLSAGISSRVWRLMPLRPVEGQYTADERCTLTILSGGLTWKHERLIAGLGMRNHRAIADSMQRKRIGLWRKR